MTPWVAEVWIGPDGNRKLAASQTRRLEANPVQSYRTHLAGNEIRHRDTHHRAGEDKSDRQVGQQLQLPGMF